MASILLIAGCGRAIPTSQGGPATVTADGPYLVDEAGHALYVFEADEEGESYCTDACASVWPPYEASGQVMAGEGVSPKLLGTAERDDGGTQITYAGEPLYYYSGDAGQPDVTSGEEITQFGAEWYLVSPKDGASVEAAAAAGGES